MCEWNYFVNNIFIGRLGNNANQTLQHIFIHFVREYNAQLHLNTI